MAAMTPVTTTKDLRITAVRVTPVAVPEPPLLNALGVHEPYALRSIVELDTGAGITGVGETYGDDQTLARLHAVADRLIGLDALTWAGCSAAPPRRSAPPRRTWPPPGIRCWPAR